MHLLIPLIPLIPLTILTTTALATSAIKNTTREYYLKTALKPNQPGKERYNNLWLEAYHTGAGENDAVMVPDEAAAIKGFLNGTNGKEAGVTYQNQVFDLGNPFAWTMVMVENANFYAAWEPVRVNAGGGPSDPKGDSGFYINETGLQWTDALTEKPNGPGNSFGGWLVCNWWHNAPQLFFRISYYTNVPAPCSCADVWLCPVYI